MPLSSAESILPHKSQALFLDTQVSSMEVARELKLRRREGELVDFGDQSLTGGHQNLSVNG